MSDQTVDLYRLISETVTSPHGTDPTGGVTYSFDGVGNRQTRASSLSPIPTQTFSGAYDQNDRLTAGYTYDNDGNTLTDPAGNSYQYDSLDRLTQATMGTTVINYVYDGDGNRVSKTVNGVTTNYLVDTNNLTGFAQVVDELQGGVVKKVYTYGSSLISMDDLTGPTMHYFGKDGQGSTRFLMDSIGAITDTYDYDAFGNLINSTGTTSNAYLYDGEQFDPDLGQYYLRARYLNQAIGRFQTMDSDEGQQEDPLSLHKYTFTSNNPTSKIDPTGHDTIDDEPIVFWHPADNSPKSVSVFVWEYRSAGAAGHVSMNLNTLNVYVSWWPINEFYPSWVRLIENALSSTPAYAQRSLQIDSQGEGRGPDHEIDLNTYSEKTIYNWWSGFKTPHNWNVYTQNCAETVADGLENAGAKGKPTDFLMKPSPDFLRWVGLLKSEELGNGH